MSAKVIVTISPKGEVKVEAEGWQGPTCATITRPYVKALGQEVSEEIKPEMYEQPTTLQQEQQQ